MKEKLFDFRKAARDEVRKAVAEILPSATDTNVGGNLIDRQAALDAIKKLEKPAPTAQHLSAIFDCEDTIMALPSAQPVEDARAMCGECDAWNQYKNYPQPGWIPTSERLPEGIGQAIVQTNGGAIHEVFYKGKNDYGHEVWMRLDGDIYWDDEVVAWQPLPTPYREGGQDEQN